MKKIDLHVHTIKTASDSDFTFSLDTFVRYVIEGHLDVVAITNHNVFDSRQFREIQQAISAQVFPGIEINVGAGHLLLISDEEDLTSFDAKCSQVSSRISNPTDSLTTDELQTIFGDLSEYLLIPHYKKAPAIQGSDFADLLGFFSAGEVDSVKKFVRAMRDRESLCPVLFSDARMKDGMAVLPTRQVFIDCGEIALSAVKSCLSQKDKVSLSENDGNALFQVFEDGQQISTGLNVVLGDRSSGKTYTLNRISQTLERVKYIKQFELVQSSEEEDERQFNSEVERRRSIFVDDYLSGFRAILNDMSNVDTGKDDSDLQDYLASLLRAAEEADRRDAFSRVKLYDEVAFSISGNEGLKKLISSVIHVAENTEYRAVIESHVELAALRSLALELIATLWKKADEDRNRRRVNAIVQDVKDRLRMRTSATHVEAVDLYRLALNKRKVSRFNEIGCALRAKGAIFDEWVQGFRVVATKGPYTQASEMAGAIRRQVAFKEALKAYDEPYELFRVLMQNEKLDESDIYKLFAKISYRILNREGTEVSGGERSEFRLLQAIKDAQNYDMLLVDEPESSFDNKFLNSDVNAMIKGISREMPVVVVTHNNNVGASISPDYVLLAQRAVESGEVKYRLFSGYPTDKHLECVDGTRVKSHEVLLNSLEAGVAPYDDRRRIYEAVKD
ncbi:MAG TPA: PHP domain-containing protein [Acidobacteriota bacterium]|nr:PHP domain-containing protein [Acidobacteriota bacterium]HNT17151.1 PHP domain-containing protein [Acidobacteriota bacterium]